MPAAFDVTVVVPTFNEGGNIATLVSELAGVLPCRAEILFVDDSTDDTPAIIAATAAASRMPVRLLHREAGERAGGLAGAVVAGMRLAHGARVVVMDGDLQHPPELVPALLEACASADLAIASRYAGGGDAGGLSNLYRRLVSSGSTVLARGLFPRRVGRHCTDPMTGFFCLRRDAIDLERLRPQGFKILLELMASHDLTVREIPFVFGERLAGESKASWRNGVIFLRQLLALRLRLDIAA